MRTVPIVTTARMMIVIVQHNHTRAGPIMVVAVLAAYVVDVNVVESNRMMVRMIVWMQIE